MGGPSDEALLAGLGAGDPEAGAAFVRRFQGRVFGLATTILGDAEAAEDVAQDAFVRAWRYAQSYDARRGRVDTWLLTITRNIAVETLRLRRRGADARAADLVAVTSADSEIEPEALDRADRVRAAIRALPVEQAKALYLAVVFGYTSSEVAESERIPLGTAKTRVRSALLKVRAYLEVDPR